MLRLIEISKEMEVIEYEAIRYAEMDIDGIKLSKKEIEVRDRYYNLLKDKRELEKFLKRKRC